MIAPCCKLEGATALIEAWSKALRQAWLQDASLRPSLGDVNEELAQLMLQQEALNESLAEKRQQDQALLHQMLPPQVGRVCLNPETLHAELLHQMLPPQVGRAPLNPNSHPAHLHCTAAVTACSHSVYSHQMLPPQIGRVSLNPKTLNPSSRPAYLHRTAALIACSHSV